MLLHAFDTADDALAPRPRSVARSSPRPNSLAQRAGAGKPARDDEPAPAPAQQSRELDAAMYDAVRRAQLPTRACPQQRVER